MFEPIFVSIIVNEEVEKGSYHEKAVNFDVQLVESLFPGPILAC
jgi:hypothetical protein